MAERVGRKWQVWMPLKAASAPARSGADCWQLCAQQLLSCCSFGRYVTALPHLLSGGMFCGVYWPLQPASLMQVGFAKVAWRLCLCKELSVKLYVA